MPHGDVREGPGGIGIEKPKGMRWATFDRRTDQLERIEAVVDAHIWLLLQRLPADLRP